MNSVIEEKSGSSCKTGGSRPAADPYQPERASVRFLPTVLKLVLLTTMLQMKTPQQRNARRRAMTLVEVLVVVVLSSLVMGVVISFTVALQQSDRNMRSFAVRIERVSELAAALRSDLRQSKDVSLPSMKKLAIKLGGGGEIQYELSDRGCQRVVPVEGNAPAAREFFAVGPAEKWELKHEAGGRRPLAIVIMQFAERDKQSESRPAPLLVCAALGADLPEVVTLTTLSNGKESEQKREEVEQEVAEEAEEDQID
jgi:prepilin-type N-terminal cleavage/methylation domain-containing protein